METKKARLQALCITLPIAGVKHNIRHYELVHVLVYQIDIVPFVLVNFPLNRLTDC